MPAGRRSARRQAVFTLYQQELLDLSAEAALRRADVDADSYSSQLVLGVGADRDAIDQVLREHLAGWDLDRLGILERSILRVAVYELLKHEAVPAAVVIDEAVELAKRFCSAEAGSLINGVLGSIVASGSILLRDAGTTTTETHEHET